MHIIPKSHPARTGSCPPFCPVVYRTFGRRAVPDQFRLAPAAFSISKFDWRPLVGQSIKAAPLRYSVEKFDGGDASPYPHHVHRIGPVMARLAPSAQSGPKADDATERTSPLHTVHVPIPLSDEARECASARRPSLQKARPMRKVHRAQQKAARRGLGLTRLSRRERVQHALETAFVTYAHADLSGARLIASCEPVDLPTEGLEPPSKRGTSAPVRATSSAGERGPLAARTLPPSENVPSNTGHLSHFESLEP
jgi:hypothetical protein